jgi:hypothetical protein
MRSGSNNSCPQFSANINSANPLGNFEDEQLPSLSLGQVVVNNLGSNPFQSYHDLKTYHDSYLPTIGEKYPPCHDENHYAREVSDLSAWFAQSTTLSKFGSGSYNNVYFDSSTQKIYKFPNALVLNQQAKLPSSITVKVNQYQLNQAQLIQELTSPWRVCRYWNKIYNLLGLQNYANATIIKVNGQFGIELPFIGGVNYNPELNKHRQLLKILLQQLNANGLSLQDYATSGNVKIIQNAQNTLQAVPVDIDFISSKRKDSFASLKLEEGLEQTTLKSDNPFMRLS